MTTTRSWSVAATARMFDMHAAGAKIQVHAQHPVIRGAQRDRPVQLGRVGTVADGVRTDLGDVGGQRRGDGRCGVQLGVG